MCTRKQILDSRPRSEWERLIEEWIYDELDRRILRRYLFDGITFDKLTEEIQLNRQIEVDMVRRRFHRAFERLLNYAEFPLLSCCGAQVVATQLSNRTKYKVRVSTTASGGSLKVLCNLRQVDSPTLASLNDAGGGAGA